MLDGDREESNFGWNVSAPNRTIAVTHYETADRPGSSDATVPWCFRRPPNGWGSETHTGRLSTAMTRCNESPINKICVPDDDALRCQRFSSTGPFRHPAARAIDSLA